MKRGKKIVLLCHCILNANSKVEGLATYKGAMKDIVGELIERGIGIIQLPCPELTMLGVKRWGQTKEQYDTPFYREHCRELIKPVLNQVKNYIENGYEIIGLFGIDGSPSCGAYKTCCGNWGGELSENPHLDAMLSCVSITEGSGVFIEEMKQLLSLEGIVVPMLGIDETDIDCSLKEVRDFLSDK